MIARRKKRRKAHTHTFTKKREREEREKHVSQICQINNKNNIDDKQPEERSRYKIHHTHTTAKEIKPSQINILDQSHSRQVENQNKKKRKKMSNMNKRKIDRRLSRSREKTKARETKS